MRYTAILTGGPLDGLRVVVQEVAPRLDQPYNAGLLALWSELPLKQGLDADGEAPEAVQAAFDLMLDANSAARIATYQLRRRGRRDPKIASPLVRTGAALVYDFDKDMTAEEFRRQPA